MSDEHNPTMDEALDHLDDQDEALDHLDDEEGEDDEIVTLTDDNGNETEYQFLAIVEVDGESYALLTPADALDNDSNETEIFIFHYSQNADGNEVFTELPDEATFQKVQAAAEALFAAGEEEHSA